MINLRQTAGDSPITCVCVPLCDRLAKVIDQLINLYTQ